jgi:galactokinase
MRDAAAADAPGRVNLIGEHTDYHEGYVLPAVIPLRTRVQLERRGDGRVRVSSAACGAAWEEYLLGEEAPGREWLDYVQGVTAVLGRRGLRMPGLDVHIQSTVPVGAGVSSSAALQVALLRALRALLGLEVDDIDIARLAHAAESEFVGVPVGIMDQFASSVGREGEALFLDTRTLATERLPMPAHLEVAVIASGVRHAHAGGGYASRRRESFAAASLLGVRTLRDIDATLLPHIDDLPPVLARRARHVVTENDRVLAAVAALRAGDAMRLGALFAASHASMRDDYEVSTPDIDVLVSVAQAHPDVHGARLTGGGFGGSVVLLVCAGRGRIAADAVRTEYERRTGRIATVLVPSAPHHQTVLR